MVGDQCDNFLETVFDVPQNQNQSQSHTAQTSQDKMSDEEKFRKPPIRFDPFVENSHIVESNKHTPQKVPPRVETHMSDKPRDEGNIFSPEHKNSVKKSLRIESNIDHEVGSVCQGMVLGRVSARSLLMRDWTPFFFVIMKNSDIRYYEDPSFLRKNNPDDYSIVIYRERDDFERNPLGTAIKKLLPIRPNYCCSEVKRKDYSGEYGQLYYFVVKELSEIKDIPVAKFASNNRTDIDMMWMHIRCQIASAKKRQITHLVGL